LEGSGEDGDVELALDVQLGERDELPGQRATEAQGERLRPRSLSDGPSTCQTSTRSASCPRLGAMQDDFEFHTLLVIELGLLLVIVAMMLADHAA